MSKKTLVINFGSTSTKVAYYEDTECKIRENLTHDAEFIKGCKELADQYEMRISAIRDFLAQNKIDINELDAIAPRGGQTEPIPGGTWQVNEAMLEQTKSGEYGHHVCNLGPWIAYDLCVESDHAIPLTTDTPTTDEMDTLARYSGIKEIQRVSCVQMLNTKAMARYWAEAHNKSFEEVRLVMVMLGGGIGIVGIKDGRAFDAPDALEGEGPFSNNRCGTVPVGKIVKACFDSGRTREEMIRYINGEAGLTSYLGTTDLHDIMGRIERGDEEAREVIQAMCYQTSKEIGAMSCALEGKVDAIVLIGGMANVDFIVDEIKNRCSWIAPIDVLAGEREMEALAQGAYEGLSGIRPIQEFIPSK